MHLSKQDREEFEALAKPLIQFLRDKCHPHVTIVIDNQSAELLEGLSVFTVPFTPPTPKGE